MAILVVVLILIAFILSHFGKIHTDVWASRILVVVLLLAISLAIFRWLSK
jgi:hypothetical protein